ncbi:MAG: hypothetical protein PVF83_08920 [Anaerolineales bacterium]|jgi:hypothetical protein
MKKITVYQIITILVTLVTITVNSLANTLPLNEQTTGEISDRFAIYFVPAGYVFSIWGVIYLGLIAFTIYQTLPAQRENELLKKIAPAYWIGNLANTAWIFLWHYEYFPLTLIAMFMLLGALLYIYQQISQVGSEFDRNQKWFVKYPFSIYLGWISVATIANVSQVLFFLGWGGWGIPATAWAIIMLTIATVLGLLMLWRENDTAVVLVLIWAFIGIAVSQANVVPLANSTWIAAALLALAIVIIPVSRGSLGERE